MIIAGHLLLDCGAGRCRTEPGWIRVDDSRIVQVETGEIPDSADFGDSETLISPGFIDAHLHLPQFDMIGTHGLPLLRWLHELTFPEEMRWADLDFAKAMSRRVMNELLSFGTTGICAYATVHHESARAALEIASAIGMRGVIGQVLMDRQAPPELCRESQQLLAESESLCERFPPDRSMAAAVTPRFAISCTIQLLEGAGRLARKTGALVQTHLAETLNECHLVRELFGGRDYVDVYQSAGLLRTPSVFGHGIYLREQDRYSLRNAGATIAHCPTANSFLRSGTMDRSKLMTDGVSIALGSDIGAGYERSMVRVARAMIEAAASIGEEFPTAATAWYAITAGNADCLGWSDVGRLQAGSRADVVVIRPRIAWMKGNLDPLATLMFAWDDRWIERVFLRGQSVYVSAPKD